jgi:plastocyanin
VVRSLTERARSISELEFSFDRLFSERVRPGFALLCALALSLTGGLSSDALAARVEVRVEYTASSKKNTPRDRSQIVILLTPLSEPLAKQADRALAQRPHHFQLVQSHKTFDPHLLVVPIGSAVDFPNRDPFFHNVFSLFNGKRFDLGLYEAGATRSVKFDRAGVSYIFCNIHPQMSAVIITAQTPYYAITDELGAAAIRNVPDGQYRVRVWSEHALPQTLLALSHDVVVRGNTSSLGLVQIRATGDILSGHKDMYGRDYDPVTPASSPYDR